MTVQLTIDRDAVQRAIHDFALRQRLLWHDGGWYMVLALEMRTLEFASQRDVVDLTVEALRVDAAKDSPRTVTLKFHDIVNALPTPSLHNVLGMPGWRLVTRDHAEGKQPTAEAKADATNDKGYYQRSIAAAIQDLTSLPHPSSIWIDGAWYLPLQIRERWWEATPKGIPIRVSAVSRTTADVVDAREFPNVIKAVRHTAHGQTGWRFVTYEENSKKAAEPTEPAYDGLSMESPAPKTRSTFEIGDVVVLKSGGPRMTICGTQDDGQRLVVDCVWFMHHSPVKNLERFDAKTLLKV